MFAPVKQRIHQYTTHAIATDNQSVSPIHTANSHTTANIQYQQLIPRRNTRLKTYAYS